MAIKIATQMSPPKAATSTLLQFKFNNNLIQKPAKSVQKYVFESKRIFLSAVFDLFFKIKFLVGIPEGIASGRNMIRRSNNALALLRPNSNSNDWVANIDEIMLDRKNAAQNCGTQINFCLICFELKFEKIKGQK